MSNLTVLATLLCVLCIAIGQLLFKKAALALPAQAQLLDWVFNGWLVASLVLYGITSPPSAGSGSCATPPCTWPTPSWAWPS